MQSPAPKPPSLLGYHRILSKMAGVRVSPLCLGTMNFGDAWKYGLGECPKPTAFEIMDHFYEQGGNFIDTANHYQNGESEVWIGEWMQERQNRDQIVLATKFTSGYKQHGGKERILANYQGNHSKSLKISMEASLQKLQTSYVDILYVHWWDFTTSIEEVMQSLHRLVLNGKVLYLGISDTPAWLVVKCNDYARFHGLTTFSVYQGHYSAAMRDIERDVLPMLESEGMALAPWGALGRGFFKSESEHGAEGRKFGPQNEKQKRITTALENIAKAKNTLITSMALAYALHKYPYIYPIVGGRKVQHLKGNIEALGLKLTEEEMDSIDDAEPFDVGFPMNFLFEYGGKRKHKVSDTSSEIGHVTVNTRLESVPKAKPIEPGAGEKHPDLL